MGVTQMNESKSVEITNVTKEFPMHNSNDSFIAVNDISVTINAGEFVTLLGPSGCGKTTTLRMLAGFENPSFGDIFLGGEKINDQPPNKRDTAMVFQSYALFPHYSIFENIAYGLRIQKKGKREIQESVIKIIKLVGLEGLEDRSPGQLSGGQQQRVALARALIMEPGVLLFDEPLSNLDAKLRLYMRTEIRKIQQRLGLTSVYVTHDQSEAMALSDRVIIMNQGKIEQVGTPEEIYQQPTSEFVADFIGTANFAEGTVKEVKKNVAAVEMLNNVVQIPIRKDQKFSLGEKVKVVIRPESITVGKEGKFAGIVELSTFMGSLQEYTIKVEDLQLFVEDSNPNGKRKYAVSESVRLNIQEESLHMIKVS